MGYIATVGRNLRAGWKPATTKGLVTNTKGMTCRTLTTPSASQPPLQRRGIIASLRKGLVTKPNS